MNSEELELSLRSEFENYLKSFRAEMREHAAELHKQFEAEMDKHRSLLDEAFRAYSARFDSEATVDAGFKASVIEHLRQARDEGAALTAAAMADAEQLDHTPVAAAPAEPANYSGLRDAINDISEQRTQATILKSLVDHAAEFAPRGAFFIIKNEHLVGWKVFGDGSDSAENAIADIRFPVSSDSILGSAVKSLKTSDGSYGRHSEDNVFLEPLQYGQPEGMHAIPLVARGRGVAVLYAEGSNANVEALETLVRIAGLTVELQASATSAKAESRETAPADFERAQQEQQATVESAPVEEVQPETQVEASGEWHEETPAAETETAGFEFTESTPEVEVHEASPFSEPVAEQPVEEVSAEFQSEEQSGEVVFDAGSSMGSEKIESSPFDVAADLEPATVGAGSGKKSKKSKEKAVEVSPANVGRTAAGLSGRQADLPIEVSDDERRPHNDARRFARLLVSEIKLYNEQRVTEGRQAGDLYMRLREAIDRSREMYDKRVQPPVAAKFDYFHYEIVNSLAEGDEKRLGNGYPGATV